MQKKTYLITGVSGFIASRTAELLLNEGHIIIGIDNNNDYYDTRLKVYRLQKLQNDPNFHFTEGDIENKNLLDSIFNIHKIDIVMNLAARAGVRYSLENPFVYLSTNTLGTLNILECMRANKVTKMIMASTSSLYAGQEMPFTEDLPVNTPLSPYAASKKGAETMAYSYHHLYGIDVSILRYFTVYGPAGRPDMSPFRFIKWIQEGTPITLYGDGTQSRDFTYVDDIAKATILAEKEMGYQIINAGGGNNPVSLNTMIQILEELLGKKAIIDSKPFHKADMMTTWADISKANNLLGWEPEISLKEGLKRSVDWYLENIDWAKDIQV
jgi:nucleoside-diphosphate-sugar epimerase